MLSQRYCLSVETDGRFATDSELHFLDHYIGSYSIRLSAYQKIRAAEVKIVQQVYAKIRAIDSNLLHVGGEDISVKWKQDTIRVLRYSATALLLDDPKTLQERLLFWFQTIMKAFNTQRSCEVTYIMMQEVIKQHLTGAEMELFRPILELNRAALGVSAP
ncbi:MAG: phycobilisome protein [Elainellaceae cyanobacterium]